MERGTDGERNGPANAEIRSEFYGAADSRFRSAYHDLSRRVVIGNLAHIVFGGRGRELLRRLKIGAKKRKHGPLSRRHRILHGQAAQSQKLRRFLNGEHAGGRERRVLAKRMAGGEDGFDIVRAVFMAKRRKGGQRNSHQRRLRIPRKRQLRVRSFPYEPGEFLAKSIVGSLEYGAGRRVRFSKLFSHTGGLAALPWKCECKRHAAGIHFKLEKTVPAFLPDTARGVRDTFHGNVSRVL
jgi:hypothetical protein